MKKLFSLALLCTVFIVASAQVQFTVQEIPVCGSNALSGAASINVTSGNPPYTYTWSGPVSGSGTSSNITGLAMGNYNVTISDALGGTGVQSFYIDSIYLEIHADTSTFCDGSLFLNVWGNYDVANLIWSGDTLLNSITFQENATYYASYTSPNGCTVADTFNTGTIPKLEHTVNVGTYNCETGSFVTVELIGSNPSKVIYDVYVEWSNQFSTGPLLSPYGDNSWELTHGLYYITSRDTSAAMLAQCPNNYVSDTIFIDADTAVAGLAFGDANINVVLGDSCSEELVLTGTPAFPVNVPLSYIWYGPNGFTSTDAVVNISNPHYTGFYSYDLQISTVACIGIAQVYDGDLPAFPNGFSLNLTSTPASCQPNGSATATPSNPSLTYDFLWDTGDTTTTISNLASGTYSVTVTDENGCFHIDSVTVVNSSGAIIQVDSVYIEKPTCDATANGSIQIFASGSPSLSYLWSTGATTTTINNLSKGTYFVTITDAGGCTHRETVVLGNSGLEVQTGVTQAPDCATGLGGALSATPLAGTAPYTYAWNTGAVTNTITGLNYGGYTITVTDDSGCVEIKHHILDPSPACFSRISGRVYIDADSNCVFSSIDIPIVGRIVRIEPGYYAYTDNQGNWQAYVAPGLQYRAYLELTGTANIYDACGIDTIPISVIDTTSINNLDLPKNKQNLTEVSISLSPTVARPGFETLYFLMIRNNGTETVSVSGTVVLDNAYTAVSPYLLYGTTIDSISSTRPYTVHYTSRNILAGAARMFVLTATLPTIPVVNLGQVLTNTATIGDSSGLDTDFTNNYDTLDIIVIGAYDPNDKHVFSNDENVDGLASPNDTLLDYIIRFQNTGTDTAFNVVIRDTLDAGVNPATFRVLNASHPMQVQFYEDRIVHFIFNNILLPDSNVNEPLSHGAVSYQIAIEDPSVLQPVSNQAAIYFDFNPPIYTNTVTTMRAENPVVLGTSSLCGGDTIQLSANLLPDFTYYWTQDGSPIPNATGTSISVSDSGSYQLYLVYGDDEISSVPFQVSYFANPTASISPANNTVCEDAPAVNITVSPTGGVLTGNGISGTTFSPAAAGAGIHPLQYTYTDGNNCSTTVYDSVLVNASPTASLSPASNSVCEGAPAISITVSPAGGVLTGSGISGTSFSPTTAGTGIHPIQYTYTDGNNCSTTVYDSVLVNANPTASLSPASNTVCEGASAINITVSPVGGMLTGSGISGTDFDPVNAGIGTHSLTYAYTDNNGCADTTTASVSVTALPNATLSLPIVPFCKSSTPIDLTAFASPAGGIISGDSVSGSLLSVSTPGNYAINYTYTDNNGCAKTVQANAVVDECIGIGEADFSFAQVHPNPTTGIITVSLGGKQITQLVLLDVTGKQVLTQQYQPNTDSAVLDASQLSNGIYMLKAYSGSTWYGQRIVLQR